MSSWETDDLALLGRMAGDLTALAATIEILARRQPSDVEVRRAERLVLRLHGTVTALIIRLKG